MESTVQRRYKCLHQGEIGKGQDKEGGRIRREAG